MFRNYFLIALRHIKRNKLFSVLNILGLAIGIVSCLLIYIYIEDEVSFDRHHTKADQIYRIQCFYKFEDVEDKFGISPFPVMPTLKQEYPEITDGCRLFVLGNVNVFKEEKVFNLDNAYFADSNFFKIFEFKFVSGSPENALSNPENVVLTKSYATKIFGEESPMGKVLLWNNKNLKVSGIIDEKTYNTHIDLGMFIPVSNMNPQFKAGIDDNWGNNNSFSYVVIPDQKTAENFQPKMDAYVKKYVLPQWEKFGFNGSIKFFIEPLKDIHFNNYLIYDTTKKGNYGYVKIFSAVALLILCIACINYTNMSTAAATRRSKEVAMRKVAGATKRQLVLQFVGESFLLAIIALLLSFGLLEILLPLFNDITGKEIVISDILKPGLILVITGILFTVGILAGSFPAFFMSRFAPQVILKESMVRNGGRHTIRRILMTAQFSISIFMIIATLIVYSQLNYMRNKEMGFDRENLLTVRVPNFQQADSLLIKKMRGLKDELKMLSFVKDASFSAYIPGENVSRFVLKVKTSNGMQDKPIATMFADYDYPKMMGMKLMQGRYFDEKNIADQNSSIIINQATVKLFGWKDPLNQSLYIPDSSLTELKVIGVMEDFHFASLHSPIEPVVLFMNNPSFVSGHLSVKLQPGDINQQLQSIESIWKKTLTNKEFEFQFLDDAIFKLYLNEEKMFKVFVYFALLALLLSCMGLYGLSFFSTQQRTKEIGIRKVMGASTGRIILLLNREFIVMIGFASLITFPVAWWVVSGWLEAFAYRTPISISVFAIALVFTLILSILTVSLQVFKTARLNPVKSLRYE